MSKQHRENTRNCCVWNNGFNLILFQQPRSRQDSFPAAKTTLTGPNTCPIPVHLDRFHGTLEETGPRAIQQ